jgi:hypothetical protein
MLGESALKSHQWLRATGFTLHQRKQLVHATGFSQ